MEYLVTFKTRQRNKNNKKKYVTVPWASETWKLYALWRPGWTEREYQFKKVDKTKKFQFI